MIKTREEFAEHFNASGKGLGNPDSPLWIPETMDNPAVTCEWFLCIKPLYLSGLITSPNQPSSKVQFWDWCHKHLTGKVRCFSSGNHEEWWGFTEKNDAMWFRLRWA